MNILLVYISISVVNLFLLTISNLLEREDTFSNIFFGCMSIIPVLNIILFIGLFSLVIIKFSDNKYSKHKKINKLYVLYLNIFNDKEKKKKILCIPSGEVVIMKNYDIFRYLFDKKIIKWNKQYKIHSINDKYKKQLK